VWALVWPLVWLKQLFPLTEGCTVVSNATTSKGDNNVHQAELIGTTSRTNHATDTAADHVAFGADAMLACAIAAPGTGCQSFEQHRV
jgi:hypothetical protein